MIQIRVFGLRVVFTQPEQGTYNLVSVKAGKPAEGLCIFSPFTPVQGQAMEMVNPVSFSGKFSKLYLAV